MVYFTAYYAYYIPISFQMLKLRSEPFDSCAKNVINEGGEDTVGNVMCEMITEFYSEEDIPVAELNRGIKVSHWLQKFIFNLEHSEHYPKEYSIVLFLDNSHTISYEY